jgi:CheY-like chemotaxis protein
MRSEAARISHGEQSNAAAILRKAIDLLRSAKPERRAPMWHEAIDSLPLLAVDPGLLRQLLLSVLSELADSGEDVSIMVEGEHRNSREVCLTIRAESSRFTEISPAPHSEIADACQIQIDIPEAAPTARIYRLTAPVALRAADVLVVDDNADILRLYESYLAPHGYHVHTAESGARALEMLGTASPQAVFADVMMPDQDGWELLQHLTHDPRTRAIPVIICSVLQQRELALSLGAADFIRKPFTAQHLLDALSRLNQA